jgi:alpha-glucosidase
MSNNNSHWYDNGVLYQIYPLSFADSDNDGFGDLEGIIDHLDYLNDGTAESLGVAAIWLSPVFESPMADWGYDISNYSQIDPIFGGMADLDILIFEAHKRGIKVLLDLVVNHTSVENEWFRQSRSSRLSEKRNWYIWADPSNDGGPPNNWLSRFGGSAWSLDESTGQYYLHTFSPEQPDLNWRNKEVREEITKIMRFWLDRGVDGFRADAVTSLMKDEKLRDDPPNPNYTEAINEPDERNIRQYSEMGHEYVDIITSFCEIMDQDDDRFLISEAYLDVPGLQDLYRACDAHPIHAPFNFNLLKLKWSATVYRDFIAEYELSMMPEDLPNYVLGNHDRSRVATRVGVAQARLLAMMQMTLRGLPVIYYGEELGMKDIETNPSGESGSSNVARDRFGRDRSRAPMVWSENDVNITTKKTWLPRQNIDNVPTVEDQNIDPQSMLNFYRHIIHLRGTLGALSLGNYEPIETSSDDVFAYMRDNGSQQCYIFLNFSENTNSIDVNDIGKWIAGTHLVDGDGEAFQQGEMILEGYEGRLYEKRIVNKGDRL